MNSASVELTDSQLIFMGIFIGVFMAVPIVLIGRRLVLLGRRFTRAIFKSKSRRAIALSAITFGWLGIHRFKLGNKRQGYITLAITVASIIPLVPGGLIMFIIGVIEGVKYFRMSDEQFKLIYVSGSKKWF